MWTGRNLILDEALPRKGSGQIKICPGHLGGTRWVLGGQKSLKLPNCWTDCHQMLYMSAYSFGNGQYESISHMNEVKADSPST